MYTNCNDTKEVQHNQNRETEPKKIKHKLNDSITQGWEEL